MTLCADCTRLNPQHIAANNIKVRQFCCGSCRPVEQLRELVAGAGNGDPFLIELTNLVEAGKLTPAEAQLLSDDRLLNGDGSGRPLGLFASQDFAAKYKELERARVENVRRERSVFDTPKPNRRTRRRLAAQARRKARGASA